MDKNDVKVCLRALISSSSTSYSLHSLLKDYRTTTGSDLPLFGYKSPVEFLQTLEDTVRLLGSYNNPIVCLVESQKSSHITSLVDRQRNSTATYRGKRIIFPSKPVPESVRAKRLSCSEYLPPLINNPPFLDQSYQIIPKATNPSDKPNPHSLEATKDAKKNSITPVDCQIISDSQYSFKVESNEETFDESHKVEKSAISYFEDISDDEAYFSSRNGSEFKTSHGSVNSGLKNKLQKLIREYPNGLWCCELPDLFLQKFNVVLDYRDYGYTSLIQMLSELPDVFRCFRPGNEDWILFDASAPMSVEEEKIRNLNLAVTDKFKRNLNRLLLDCCDNDAGSGVELDMILNQYEKMFGCSLDYQSLGFKNLQTFLEMFEGSLLKIVEINNKFMVIPAKKLTVQSPIGWKEAIPPITAENDIFNEIFPKEVVGPDENLVELDLSRHIAAGLRVEVCVAEVWSPRKFYIQLHKFKNLLNRFMDDLQRFYNVHLNKYKMPDATIRPKQVCVGLYNSEADCPDEWHRGQVVKVINEKTVLVNFVDYGTEARVKKNQLRFLHQDFKSFPVQAFAAELFGVAPLNEDDKWPVSVSKKFFQYIRVSHLEAEMVEIDFKKPLLRIKLFDTSEKSGTSINKKLVTEKMAKDVTCEESLKFQSASEKATPKNSSGGCEVMNGRFNESSEAVNEYFDVPDLEGDSFNPSILNLKLKSLASKAPAEMPKILGNTMSLGLDVKYEFEEVEDLKGLVESDTKKDKEMVVEIFEMGENLGTLNVSSTVSKEPTKEPNPCPIPEFEADSLLTANPKSKPPGLEQVNALSNFDQIKYQVMEKEVKKRINLLSLELLTNNVSIKQVALNDPELALKIATEMAQAYVASEYSNKLSLYYIKALNPLFPNVESHARSFTPPAPPSTPSALSSLPSPSTPPETKSRAGNGQNIPLHEPPSSSYDSDPESVLLGRQHFPAANAAV